MAEPEEDTSEESIDIDHVSSSAEALHGKVVAIHSVVGQMLSNISADTPTGRIKGWEGMADVALRDANQLIEDIKGELFVEDGQETAEEPAEAASELQPQPATAAAPLPPIVDV